MPPTMKASALAVVDQNFAMGAELRDAKVAWSEFHEKQTEHFLQKQQQRIKKSSKQLKETQRAVEAVKSGKREWGAEQKVRLKEARPHPTLANPG